MDLIKFWWKWLGCLFAGGHVWDLQWGIRQEDEPTNVYRFYECRRCGTEDHRMGRF